MAKIRALKPEFFTDEKVVELSPLARLLYQGMWVHACDNGHLEDRPKQLKLRILPADNCDVSALLDEILAQDMAHRTDGWLVIPTLTDHQKPDKRYFKCCDFPGCKEGKPALSTRQEAPPEPEECPPDPQGEHYEQAQEPLGDHTGATPGPHRENDEATRSPSTDGDGDGDGDGDKEPLSELRPDVESILDYLDGRLAFVGIHKRPNRTKGNRDAARLMLDVDKGGAHEIHQVIDWATQDAFWSTHIRSARKLREKYPTLRAQMLKPRPGPPATKQDRNLAILADAERRWTQQDELGYPDHRGEITA